MDSPFFQNDIVPFYFGASPNRLYGCHHIPRGVYTKECSVVLCSPIGQEYLQSHRVAYQLAVRLALLGFHVLRFDYFGCGDSEGDFEQGTLPRWIEDTRAAIEEMHIRSGRRTVCLIGLRMGATLALEAAENCGDIRGVVLWEAIFDGKAYLKELDKRQKQLHSTLNHLEGRGRSFFTRSRKEQEVLGFPMTPELRQDLESVKMDLSKLRSKDKSLIVINTKRSNSFHSLRSYVKDHPEVDFQVMSDRMAWEDARIIPIKTVDYLVNWVEKAFS